MWTSSCTTSRNFPAFCPNTLLWLKFLLHIRLKRTLARARSDFPCAFLLPGLVTGQLLCQLLQPAAGQMAAAALLLAVPAIIIGKSRILLFSAVIGALSSLPSPPAPPPENNRSHLAAVAGQPRRRKTNQLELTLEIKGSLTKQGLEGRPPARVLCKAIDLPWRNLAMVQPGAEFIMRGSFRPLEKTLNPFSYAATLRRRGIAATCKIRWASRPSPASHDFITFARRALITRVLAILGDTELAGLFLSISIGTRDLISSDTEQAFKRTGLAHLLVVSGYQVTLVYLSALFVIRRLLTLSPRLCLLLPARPLSALLSLLSALLFVWLSGMETSGVRAAMAIIFVVVAACFERGGGMVNSICFSFLMLALLWPGAYCEPGLQLTYAALFGLAAGAHGQGKIARYLKACFSASLFTSLVVLLWFDQFSLIGFALNPVIAPLASWLGCNAGLVALAATAVDRHGLLLQAVALPLAWFRALVVWLAGLSWAALSLEGPAKTTSVAALLAAVVALLARRALWYLFEHDLILEERAGTPALPGE